MTGSVGEHDYDASSLQVLEGLDAVRKRPGMYIGTTGSGGLQHCVWEIVDNAVDEALAGFCRHIVVTLHEDGSISVSDDGRGIPTDVEPKTGLSGVEVVFTKLHAGGKFGGGGYAVSGGLHGVGASVVNALSTRVDVTVRRKGRVYSLSFDHGVAGNFDDSGVFTPGTIREIGKCKADETGTLVRFWPDRSIFLADAEVDFGKTLERARQTAYLVPGLSVRVVDERSDSARAREDERARRSREEVSEDSGEESAARSTPVRLLSRDETFRAERGIGDFVEHLTDWDKDKGFMDVVLAEGVRTFTEVVPVLEDGMMVSREVERSCEVRIAYRWTTGYDTLLKSFVNVVVTPGGGTHVQGFERSLVKTVNELLREMRILKDKEANVVKDDILEGLCAVVLVRLSEPQFEGQTKEILGTGAVGPIVQEVMAESLRSFASGKSREKARIAFTKVKKAAEARIYARTQRETVRRKNALDASSSMPAKLVDVAKDAEMEFTELFIIEGDSAAGTVKKARDGRYQALLPIRGKILNTMKATEKQMLANKECQDIIVSMGAGSGKDFDIEKANYSKLIVLADADVDGAHIRCLILTLAYRYMRPLLTHGRVYSAVPPLYGLRLSPDSARKLDVVYAYSDGERDQLVAKYAKEGRTVHEVQRYKGLGEMDADQLAETTMDRSRRKLRRMTMRDAEEASRMFEILMGQDVPARRDFIAERGALLDLDDIDV